MVNMNITKYFQKKQWKDMCLILFSYDIHPRYKLVLASNRDEFYSRPTKQLHFWEDTVHEKILAGRDEQDKGTWLGVTATGRFSAITNFRSMSHVKSGAPSRGLLVSNYLSGSKSPHEYLEDIKTSGHLYSGFNLLVGDRNTLYYYSNINNEIVKVEPGIHGLSNAFLDTPWPKIRKGKAGIKQLVSGEGELFHDKLFELMADSEYPPESELPDTGVGEEWERILSPLFIESDVYGTRATTIITIDNNLCMNVIEKTFKKGGNGITARDTVSMTINMT